MMKRTTKNSTAQAVFLRLSICVLSISCSTTAPQKRNVASLELATPSTEKYAFNAEEIPLHLQWSFSYPRPVHALIAQQTLQQIKDQIAQTEQSSGAANTTPVDPAQALETSNTWARLYADLIQKQILTGDVQGATIACKKALLLAPEHPYLLLVNAFLHYQNKQVGLAKYLLNRIRVHPELAPLVENNLALILLNEGKTFQALELFRKALTLKPDYWVAGRNLAQVFYQNNDYAAAAEVIKQTYQEPFLAQEKNYFLGMVYCADRQYNLCLESLSGVLESNALEQGAFPEFNYLIGGAYWLRYQNLPVESRDSGDLNKALEHLQKYFLQHGASMAPDHEVRQWLLQIRPLVKT